MELHCLQSTTLSSIPRCGLTDTSFLRGHTVIRSPTLKKTSRDVGRAKLLVLKARTSGITKIKAQAKDASPSDAGTKDGNVVFVAGATGKVGSRAVRELLKLGFQVRAGVRSVKRAESLVQSVRTMKLEGGSQAIDKLELVECDLEKQDQIEPALGNSSIVMCCIGASEKEILDVSGPYRIDYEATKNLIDAATSAKVNHFILLTSLGTNKVGFPAAVLNLFWGVLLWKRKAEEALLASGLPYTIVRPGGMERPTDSFKETHNITLSEQDTLFGGLVSNLQVAELMAFIAKNRSLSCCKVLEVTAETSAPLTPMGELLAKIPSDRGKVCPPPKESDGPTESKQVPDTIHAVKEPEITKPTPSTPSSPYIAYEDLKPPTSPIPTRPVSTSKVEIPPTPTISDVEVTSMETLSIINGNIAPEIELKKQYSSSPYSNYEDLKPPTSPTPTPSGSKKAPSTSLTPVQVVAEEPQITEGNDIAKIGSTIASDHSPYLAYADLKPPTSPSPSVPTLSGNGKPAESPAVENVNQPIEPKATPLSPYTMYEDLKPPTSPVPLPNKL